jgi:hypothetical protein
VREDTKKEKHGWSENHTRSSLSQELHPNRRMETLYHHKFLSATMTKKKP